MANEIVRGGCQLCGEERALMHATLSQNIGLLVVRFPKKLSGLLCKQCIGKKFWEYTLISFFLGWWGVISFFYTLVAIPSNIATYAGSRRLE